MGSASEARKCSEAVELGGVCREAEADDRRVEANAESMSGTLCIRLYSCRRVARMPWRQTRSSGDSKDSSEFISRV